MMLTTFGSRFAVYEVPIAVAVGVVLLILLAILAFERRTRP